jgi:hypothetical protein
MMKKGCKKIGQGRERVMNRATEAFDILLYFIHI